MHWCSAPCMRVWEVPSILLAEDRSRANLFGNISTASCFHTQSKVHLCLKTCFI